MTAIAALVILKSDLANSSRLLRMDVNGSDTCQMLVLEFLKLGFIITFTSKELSMRTC